MKTGKITPQEAIADYRDAGLALADALEESNAAIRAFHRSCLDEIESIVRGEAADLIASARVAIRLHAAGERERAAVQRAQEMRVRALRAVIGTTE